jgi:putative ABC transport system substrate-binding protein
VIRRREFISLLGSAAATWPLVARAQPANKKAIGFLGADATSWKPWAVAFEGRLRELGWIDGQTIGIEYRWYDSRADRLKEVASEFVRLKVDAIVANGIAIPVLKKETTVIPIVFAVAVDPVGGGLVPSLAHPGGNVTGLSAQGPDLASKRLELLRAVIPELRRLAVMFNADFGQAGSEMAEVQTTARQLGLDVVPLEIRGPQDIAKSFTALGARADALYVVGDALTSGNRNRIITFALTARLPTIFNTSDHARAGSLLSYGPNFPDLFRRTAELVDKILRGANPGDIPVEQPTKFDLALNLITATALGLTVPPKLLFTADEVIE